MTITSKAELAGLADAPSEAADSQFEGLKVLVEKSTGDKCVRCWHYIDDVGSNEEHPSVCGRCIENIEWSGRDYVTMPNLGLSSTKQLLTLLGIADVSVCV